MLILLNRLVQFEMVIIWKKYDLATIIGDRVPGPFFNCSGDEIAKLEFFCIKSRNWLSSTINREIDNSP